MELLLWDEAKDWVQKKEGYIYHPDFNTCEFLNKWIETCGEVYSPEMCRVLNLINNQGIEYITLKDKGYVIKGKWVELDCLSSSERWFFCAELARQKQTHIYLYKGRDQLWSVTQGVFYREFIDCEYIHVLFEHEGYRYIFRRYGGEDVRLG